MGRLEARKHLAPPLLHFIVQDGLQPACGVALADIGHCCLADIKGRDEVSIGPPLVHFEQHPCSGQDARIGFAAMHKHLKVLALIVRQGNGLYHLLVASPFALSIPRPWKKLNGLTTNAGWSGRGSERKRASDVSQKRR
jgi:hypothetical protein